MELLGSNPGRKIAVYFLATIVVGAALLMLPLSGSEKPVGAVNALFTATSAICVTGLTVVDTAKDFSFFGQIIILVLIQAGGLGILTFTTALLFSMGVKLSFKEKLGVAESFETGYNVSPGVLFSSVMITTFAIEFIGAVLLFVRFIGQFPLGTAVYYSIFHSITAFCNAGFSLFSNNLEGYGRDVYTMLVVAGMIIFGGLGFVVIREIIFSGSSKTIQLSLHSRICLVTTAVLLIGGTVLFYLAESKNMVEQMGPGYGLANAFFQSVTSRTAGFNTVPQGSLTDISLFVTMALMFIGTCPGSTGGGIKTTTMAVIMLLIFSRFRGFKAVSAFNKSINTDSLVRALAVFLLAILVISSLFAILIFIESPAEAHAAGKGHFVEYLFEVISAFGTVGLSLGITPHLQDGGKIVLIILMYAGRVGLLTFAFALARPSKPGEIIYAEESVMVG